MPHLVTAPPLSDCAAKVQALIANMQLVIRLLGSLQPWNTCLTDDRMRVLYKSMHVHKHGPLNHMFGWRQVRPRPVT